MNDKIGCTMQLNYGGKSADAHSIISMIQFAEKNKIEKYTIDYGDSLEYTKDFKDDTCMKIKITTRNVINSMIKGGGIYFIFSGDGNRLLYIGKSKDLKNRLKQHLIACTLSTYSHIQDVLNYLKEQKIRKEKLVLQYCIINSVDDKHNAAIEGALIDYIQENKENEEFLSDCWNTRHD